MKQCGDSGLKRQDKEVQKQRTVARTRAARKNEDGVRVPISALVVMIVSKVRLNG